MVHTTLLAWGVAALFGIWICGHNILGIRSVVMLERCYIMLSQGVFSAVVSFRFVSRLYFGCIAVCSCVCAAAAESLRLSLSLVLSLR